MTIAVIKDGIIYTDSRVTLSKKDGSERYETLSHGKWVKCLNDLTINNIKVTHIIPVGSIEPILDICKNKFNKEPYSYETIEDFVIQLREYIRDFTSNQGNFLSRLFLGKFNYKVQLGLLMKNNEVVVIDYPEDYETNNEVLIKHYSGNKTVALGSGSRFFINNPRVETPIIYTDSAGGNLLERAEKLLYSLGSTFQSTEPEDIIKLASKSCKYCDDVVKVSNKDTDMFGTSWFLKRPVNTGWNFIENIKYIFSKFI